MENNNDHICDENCGCDDEAMATVTLTLEDNTTLECNVLGTFDVNNSDYIALVPIDSDEALIYKFSQDVEGNVTLSLIESDEEFHTASEAFYELFGEEEDFEEQ